MRRKIFEVIEKSDGKNRASYVYDLFMILVIIVSMIPLAFKEESAVFL